MKGYECDSGTGVTGKTPEKTSEKTSEKTPAGIHRLLRINPHMTIADLSAALGKTTRTIERTLAAMQEQTWSSQYAQPLDINKQYPKPVKGKAE